MIIAFDSPKKEISAIGYYEPISYDKMVSTMEKAGWH